MLRGWYGQTALAVGWATPASRLSLLGPQVKQAADPITVATGQFWPIIVQGILNFAIS
jgi:hypothetical protein